MNDDREAEILYLAHQIWEESDTPDITPQACWTRAALQVLARPRKIENHVVRPTQIHRHQRYAQAGAVICIDAGRVQPQVTLIRRSDLSRVANQPLHRVSRRAD